MEDVLNAQHFVVNAIKMPFVSNVLMDILCLIKDRLVLLALKEVFAQTDF